MISDLGLIKLFLVSRLIYLATAVVCPHSSQWKLRTRARCNSSLPSYNCLYDESTSKFVEFCTTTPDFQRPGYKFIIRGNIDGIECEKNRFQPIKFWTNGSHNCLLEKTGCNEPGQVIHDEGSSTKDRTCRCDYTRSFAFVTRTKQNCFCNPSREDCSCFLKPCGKFQVMTPDYKCIEASDWTGIFECPVITKTITTSAATKKTTKCPIPQSDLSKFSIMTMVSKNQVNLIVTVLTGSLVIIIIVLWKRGKEMKKCFGYLCMTDKALDKRMTDHTLFKMKLKVNFKDIITKINCNEIVNKLSLNDVEKKAVQACLGRVKGNKALLEIVWNRGPVFYKEFVKVVRQNNPDLAAKIEATKDSDYKEEVEEELEKIYNEKIPENVRKFHDSKIHDWMLNEEMIIETRASNEISGRLEGRNCVVLVGCPGSGKSSILHHIALTLVKKYEVEDFDIVPVVIEPSNVLDYHNLWRNQIFLLDDFCGKDKVNNQLVDVWKLDIEKILSIINQKDCLERGIPKLRKTKLMISCNTSVYNSPIFEPLKKHLENFVCELSKFPLEKREREIMIKKYAPDAKIDIGAFENKDTKLDFPLLCKLTKNKPIDEIHRLFSDPLATIKDDLKKVQTDDSLQFCAVALCTLLNNQFKVNWLNCNIEPVDIYIRNAVREMCLEFNLDLTNDADRMLILVRCRKEMEWLSQSDDAYHHIHDEIFNIAAVLCGKLYQRCFINHAPSSFIANRFNFQTHRDGFITLVTKYQKLYFDRLFRDLENGISYSTFQNIQLNDENYRTALINYCRSRKLKFKEMLGSLKSNTVKHYPLSNNVNDKTEKKVLRRQETFTDTQVPLVDSAYQGYEDMVNFLLEMGCDVIEKDAFGRTALFVASSKGKTKIVKRLVKYVEDENAKNEENKNKRAIIDLCDNKKRTSLHAACQEGREDIVQFLIEKGANACACDVNGYSPLHMACVSGKTEVVKLLFETYKKTRNETEIEKKDNLGQTPLILASAKGEKEVVNLLLDHNANISAADTKGTTSLLAASMNGYSQTVKVLIENKADIFLPDNDGRTALFIASEKGHNKIVEMLLQNKINKKIIECNDWHKKSPFYIACAEGRFKIVQRLFDNDADVNSLDEDDKSPLYVACQREHEKIVKFLLEKNAKIDTPDMHGNFPLHIACKVGNLKIVKLLNAKDTDQKCVSKTNQWQETALDIAKKQGHEHILIYLNEQNSDTNATIKNNSVLE